MANLTLDFSNEKVLHPTDSKNISFTYRDIGTSNIRYYEDPKTKKAFVSNVNSSNVDAAAIKASLNNILNFRTRRCNFRS